MHSDFSLFRERLAHACRVRSMTHDQLCASIGAGATLTLLSQADTTGWRRSRSALR
jgi:hypothetical protein